MHLVTSVHASLATCRPDLTVYLLPQPSSRRSGLTLKPACTAVRQAGRDSGRDLLSEDASSWLLRLTLTDRRSEA
eukprot:3453836-Rhodomonas_salina.3